MSRTRHLIHVLTRVRLTGRNVEGEILLFRLSANPTLLLALRLANDGPLFRKSQIRVDH